MSQPNVHTFIEEPMVALYYDSDPPDVEVHLMISDLGTDTHLNEAGRALEPIVQQRQGSGYELIRIERLGTRELIDVDPA